MAASRLPWTTWLRRTLSLRRAGMLAISFLLLTLMLWSGLWSGHVSLHVGQVAPEDIYAPRREINQPLYQQLKAQALQGVKPVYVTDDTALSRMDQKITAMFKSITQLQQQLPANASASRVEAAWAEQVGLTMAQRDVQTIVQLSPTELQDMQRLALAVASHVLGSANYQSGQLAAEKQALGVAVEAIGLPQAAQTYLLTAVEQRAALPNMRVSASETTKAQQKALAGVIPPVIEQGQLIVSRGAPVTAAQLSILREYGLLNGQGHWSQGIGAAALSLGFLLAFFGYALRFQPEVVRDDRKLMMVLIVLLVEVLVARLTAAVSPYLIPLAASSILLAVLFDASLGLAVAVVIALLLQAALGYDPHATITLILGAFAGTLSVQRLSERAQLLKAPVYIAGAGVLTVLALSLLGVPYVPNPHLLPNLLWTVVGAALAAVIALGSAPFFENYFGVLTSIKLLELSNPNQPLLRRLLLEAPGTYHHSLIVSNLCGAACDAIGANSLLARVGAFYHDIGKLRRPYFFVDNQSDGDNPHDRLTPVLSAMIITAHARDGLEMAAEYHLPKEIRSFIGEHHGTTLVSYFFNRAQQLHPDDPPKEEDFRYPGPRPQSRETAVLMLADTCEAAVRALKGRTSGRIEALVQKLVRERLYNGELDESDLTLRDLELISRAFVRVLTGVHHTRVEYPDAGLQEILRKGGGAPGGEDGQPAT